MQLALPEPSPQHAELYLSHLSRLVVARRADPHGPVSRETVRQPPLPDLEPVAPSVLPQTVQRVRCGRCGCSLTDGGRLLRLKRLPGRDWMELVDCWSCHRSEFAPLTTRLNYSQDGNTILPSPGSLLVGGMFLLANLEQDFEGMRATGGRCPGCSHQVGEEVWQLGATAATHIRLSRCEMQLESPELATPLIWSFAALVMEELRELIDSQGALSYAISSPSPDRSVVLIRLLSWAAHVRSRPAGAFRPALILQMGEEEEELTREEPPDRCHLIWSNELLEQLETLLKRGQPMAALLGYPPTHSVLFCE